MTPNLCFRLALALTLLAGTTLPHAAWGQAAAPEDDEAAVLEAVDRLLDGMQARDGAMVDSAFHSQVRVDGDLAHVWTRYRFYSGDQLSRCGYNSIQLVRTSKGWEILSLAYTDRMEGCDGMEGP